MFESSLAELYWFLLGIVFFLLEIVLPGFIIFFFGVGAWIAALAVFLGLVHGTGAQIVVFLASSLLALFLFRRKGKDYLRGTVTGRLTEGQSLDRIEGERATVWREIRPGEMGGKVEFHGTIWDAEADAPIAKDVTVEIVARRDLTLIVKAPSAASDRVPAE